MSLREECDAAEVVWGRLLDRHDELRLLAAIAKANRVKINDYEPLSVKLADGLQKPAESVRAADRMSKVELFIATTREE